MDILSKAIGPGLQDLPNEIILQIFYNMNAFYLNNLSRTCWNFYRLSQDEKLWRTLYSKAMPRTCHALLLSEVVWVFQSPGSRLFLSLIEKERMQKSDIKQLDDVSNTQLSKNQTVKETQIEQKQTPQNNPEVTEVINILKKYESRTIVLAATYIIRRLTFFPPKSPTEYIKEIEMNRNQFGNEGAIDMLLKYLEKWEDDRDVVEKTICALGNVSLVAQNITELTLKGGVDIATKFFFKYQDDPQIFDYTTFVFSRLALHSHSNIDKIYRQGIVDLLMKKLRQPNDSDIILVAACELLVQLCKDFRIRNDVVNELLCIMKSSLSKYETNTRVLSPILNCVAILCEGDVYTRDIATSLGLHELVLDIGNRYKHNPDVLNNSNLALFMVLWRRKDLTLPKKLVKRIIESMKLYPSERDLQHDSIAMLADLAESSTVLKEYIVKLDGITLVKNFAKTQSSNIYYNHVIAMLSTPTNSLMTVPGIAGNDNNDNENDIDSDD